MLNNPPPITPPLTTKIKVVNWYGRASGLLGLTPAALIPERLINRAMKKSGLAEGHQPSSLQVIAQYRGMF